MLFKRSLSCQQNPMIMTQQNEENQVEAEACEAKLECMLRYT
jgi:hypothetical protein